MFEDVPPATPIQPTPLAKPKPAPVPMADQAAIELFKRTGLNPGQKIGLLITAIVVLGGLVGVGIWLFMKLDPFAGPLREQAEQNNNATTTNIPLQDLDSDKDGLRDIDERRFGTNANLADSDSDGLNDYAELNQYRTDPLLGDTDGDTYLDGAEIANGYDPLGPGRLE